MPQPTVDPKMIEEELDRVLNSREFHDSGRMCRFLRFTVEATLAGKAEELKEYSIAVAVFDREPDFDPRTDPVVRSEARRLRSKLASYYTTKAPRTSWKLNYLRAAIFRNSENAGSQRSAAPGPTRTSPQPICQTLRKPRNHIADIS